MNLTGIQTDFSFQAAIQPAHAVADGNQYI